MGLLNTILRNIGYTNPITAIPTAIYNKATTGEFVPGVDVGATLQEGTGADTFSDITFKGGDRTPLNNNLVGLQTPGNYATMNPVSNQYEVTGGSNSGDISQTQGPTEQELYDQAVAQQQAIIQQQAAANAAAKAEEEARVRDYNRGFLGDRKTELEGLLGRTDTLEKQGLDKILRAYNDEKTRAENDYTKQMGDYSDLETEQGTNKVSSFEKLNQGANQAYRSLAQIIGRGAGTGSSAFRDLLPNAIGNQVSSGREGVLQDYGQNMQKIGKSKKEYESSFEEILRDLLNQKTASEGSFKSGLDTERQNVNLQLMEVLRQNQLNEDPKSKYETVRAAIEPYKAANTKLSNNIDNYYEQYKPTMTPKAAVINKPDLGQFTVDRANINAQNQGIVDNPYASLLRKRLEER